MPQNRESMYRSVAYNMMLTPATQHCSHLLCCIGLTVYALQSLFWRLREVVLEDAQSVSRHPTIKPYNALQELSDIIDEQHRLDLAKHRMRLAVENKQ